MRELRKRDKEIKRLRREVEEFRKKWEAENKRRRQAEDELKKLAQAKQSRRPRFPDYSLSRQEKLRTKKPAPPSPGRRTRAEKLKEVTREEDVYPQGISPGDCILAYDRIVTHIRDGQKEVVLYRIYRQKWGSPKGELPAVLPRSDYGVEVAVTAAFLVYAIGVSHAQAAQILQFFCRLGVEESEINSLLNQLGKSWQKEFETLTDLILLAMVVHIDETGWRISGQNCYTWIFTTLTHTLLLYGESRKEEVLDRILPREFFKGLGISDCLQIYEKRFTRAQKCWAHFLRKIIKLMLLYPQQQIYKKFFEALFELFRAGKKLKQNQELTAAQKVEKVKILESQIQTLCTESETRLNKNTPKDWREFVNLQKSLVRNLGDLFTFVLVAEAEPTNNRAERGLRPTAKARVNYQTSKTKKGAHRRSVIASVLTSLRQNLEDFSLGSVTQEIIRWRKEGQSLFQKQLEILRAQPP